MAYRRDELVFDLDRILQFMDACLGGVRTSSDTRGIGLERAGELVAAVLYDTFTVNNVNMHVASAEGRHWCTPYFLRAVFTYPFVVCGVKRVTGIAPVSLRAARRLYERLGFREEARLRMTARDGGDSVCYVMWKEDCRYVVL